MDHCDIHLVFELETDTNPNRYRYIECQTKIETISMILFVLGFS